MIAAFEGAWSSEGFYSREHEERRLDEGREALRRFVAREQASRRVPLAIEREFQFKLGPRRGRRAAGTASTSGDGGIVLVDYKTSEIDDAGQGRRARAREPARRPARALRARLPRDRTA